MDLPKGRIDLSKTLVAAVNYPIQENRQYPDKGHSYFSKKVKIYQ